VPALLRTSRPLPLALIAAAAAALAIALGPGTVLADNPGVGQVLVPADHVMPGETFPVTGYDLDEGISLTLVLTSGATSVDLGSGQVAPDGTLRAIVSLPVSFPNGYAELTATSTDGGRWSTYVLVGQRAEGPDAVAEAARTAPLTSVALALGVIAAAIIVVMGWRHAHR
jgi:hypothetical protein